MKNIVREVYAVSKVAVLIGIVIVAAVVAGIAYVYWPRPLSIAAFFDEGNSVSAMISPEEGGKIETTGADGTNFTLEIPKDALLGSDGETISLTPITEVENIPLSFLAGVQLEPDGLQLCRTANLTIELTNPIPADEILGFSYCGNEFHLVPLKINGTTLTFHLIHFSPYGAGKGSKSDCAALEEPTSKAKANQKISCILFNAGNDPEKLSESDMLEIIDAMLTWYSSSVEPNLNNSLKNDDLIKSAMREFLYWRNLVYATDELLGEGSLVDIHDGLDILKATLGPDINNALENCWSLLKSCIEKAFTINEPKCSTSTDRTEKIERLKKLFWLDEIILSFESELGLEPQGYESLCGGALVQPDSISITPNALTLYVGETGTLKAIAENVVGDEIADLHLVLTWENSNGAAVGLAGTSSVVSVTGKDVGQATIKVTAGNTFDPNKAVSAKSEIAVESIPKEEPEPTEPEDGKEQPVLKYRVYWKATIDTIDSWEWYTYGFEGEVIITSSHTWDITEVFEVYVEIETIPQHLWLKENKTMLVTDLSVDCYYEFHHKIIKSYAIGAPEREYYCEGYRYEINDRGIEYIKNELERNFGDFRFSTPHTIGWFRLVFEERWKGLYGFDDACDWYRYDTSPASPFYSGDCSDPEWKPEWSRFVKTYVAYMGNPGDVNYDEETQTFHKEIDLHCRNLQGPPGGIPLYAHWEIEVKPLK